jgi:hypothetical protein
MPLEDKQQWRLVWREISKRDGLDTTRMVVSCINNVVDLSGVLKGDAVRGRNMDLKKEMYTLIELIMKVPRVREVTHRNLRME